MTDTLAHRGPDGADYSVWPLTNGKGVIGFGHRRLSILDLSEGGKQPMQKYRLTITFNGEVYNFRELQQELIQLGHTFRSASDTEVVLAAFQEWGPECVRRFQGMFAFVLLDEKNGKLYFFRDRTGTKPLFLYRHAGLLLFASELKAFHAHPDFVKSVNPESVALYFQYGFVPSPNCIFNHVEKVKPGHYYELNVQDPAHHLPLKSTPYWQANDFLRRPSNTPDPAQVRLEVKELLTTAFQYRTVSDVPVGVFLSGGYDSSLVAAILQNNRTDRLKTFTIGFENPAYNEANHAQSVADHLGTDHHSYTCTEAEAKAIIPQLPEYYDEPFADSSAIPTFLVSQFASQSVKVALSADGGDELFAGYRRFKRFKSLSEKLHRLPKPARKLLGAAAGLYARQLGASDLHRSAWWSKAGLALQDPSIVNIFDVYPQYTSSATLEKLVRQLAGNRSNPQTDQLRAVAQAADPLNAMLCLEYQSTLTNDMLVKVDRATMAHSLEGREPMLDHRLFEYLAAVPASCKAPDGRLKAILKDITHQYIPSAIMDRPKQGFGVPVTDWLKSDLSELTAAHLNVEAFQRFGILDPIIAQGLTDKLKSEQTSQGPGLWMLLNFQIWCARWL